jgi:cysteine desulfurase
MTAVMRGEARLGHASARTYQSKPVFRLQRSVNLDNNATTAVSRRVRRAMNRVLRRHHGNPSGAHGLARRAATILHDSREAVAGAVGARPDEILFTSGGSEANNQVLAAIAEAGRRDGVRIVSTAIEHPSILHPLQHLAAGGCKVEWLPVDGEGRVRVADLECLLEEGASLLCCMLANNEIGTLQDLPAIAAVARRRGVPVLCDCVQALGKIPVDVRELGIDYASFSGHKLHGPKGVGALYVRRGAAIGPLLRGGHQEADLRAGTEAVHNIAGFAEACRALPELLAKRGSVAGRRDALLAELRALRPDLVVHSPAQNCLPNTLSVRFPGERNAELIAVLDMAGIAVSAGSACSTGDTSPSHVLTAIGVTEEQANETIRISLGDRTSVRDARQLVRSLGDFFSGATPAIPVVRPSDVDEAYLDDDANFVLDVRFGIERSLMKGLPNVHEASMISFGRYLHQIPTDKNILVVCSMGVDATAIAYGLHKRGYPNVSLLLGGVVGWQLAHPGLYRRLAGRNPVRLTPRPRRP